MKVLVACEESQAVTIAFRAKGHEAYSCDLQPCSGGRPEWHYQQDVFEVIDMGWDMMVAFPPCTHLAVSGAAWFKQKIADGRQQEGIDFFVKIVTAKIPLIAVENPVGIMSTKFAKPSQIIQPFYFGDPVKKTTCLWLIGLPKLVPTKIVEPELITLKTGATFSKWDYDISMDRKNRAKLRSKTFPGIAAAMADQWG